MPLKTRQIQIGNKEILYSRSSAEEAIGHALARAGVTEDMNFERSQDMYRDCQIIRWRAAVATLNDAERIFDSNLFEPV